MRLIWSSFLALLLVLPLAARADTFLLMAEEHGCPWCEKWDEEISHIYPKTLEGKLAPLRRFDLHSGWPTDLTLDRPLHFTPTFVLVVDGVASFSGAYTLLGGSGGMLDAGLLLVTYVYQVAFPGGSGRFDLPGAAAMSLLVAPFVACFLFLVLRVRLPQAKV